MEKIKENLLAYIETLKKRSEGFKSDAEELFQELDDEEAGNTCLAEAAIYETVANELRELVNIKSEQP